MPPLTTSATGRTGAAARSERRQAEILSLCSRVIAEQGYARASIRRIAAEMGLSVSALYYWFPSKQDLLFAIQFHAFREIVDRLERAWQDVADPREKLRILVGNHLDYFLGRLDELTICSHEIHTLKGRPYQRVEEVRRRYYNLALGVVREILASRGARELQASLATLNLFGMLNWIYMWINPARNRSHRALAREICELFLHGLVDGPAGGARP